MTSEKNERAIPKCQTGRKELELEQQGQTCAAADTTSSHPDTSPRAEGWGSDACVAQDMRLQTLKMQGSGRLKQPFHPASEKGTGTIAKEATPAQGSYEEAGTWALEWKEVICRK